MRSWCLTFCDLHAVNSEAEMKLITHYSQTTMAQSSAIRTVKTKMVFLSTYYTLAFYIQKEKRAN